MWPLWFGVMTHCKLLTRLRQLSLQRLNKNLRSSFRYNFFWSFRLLGRSVENSEQKNSRGIRSLLAWSPSLLLLMHSSRCTLTREKLWTLSVMKPRVSRDCDVCKYTLHIEWRTASICSSSSVPTAGHQPFVRLRSNKDTVSTFRLECSPTPGSWWRPHLRAFLAGFGILFKFISSWPGKGKRTNEELLKRRQLRRVLPFVERLTSFCWFSCGSTYRFTI